jgi:hypothetical protein
MEGIQIDLVDLTNIPVEIDGQKYIYVLSVLDNFSCFVWLQPLVRKTSLLVAKELYKIFLEYGAPKLLQCDQGGEFKGLVNKLTDMLNVRMIWSRPYHPETQGKVS